MELERAPSFPSDFPAFPSPGLKAADRTSVQNEWMEEKVPVIVATISFGMGVDKANVRCVGAWRAEEMVKLRYHNGQELGNRRGKGFLSHSLFIKV